ncbi:MAG: diacylglycerol kinase family lipid kinase [Candidatus Bipolaricaulota bacterium]|nr:diacylglycerol kinase family lipid kinase [Candidatus Bipolaricaulota bacterium]MDW8126802.1 diacylglycerol kinase family lipid kinase [Candidatus Bipolaricaulota bacterium]
MRRLPVILNPAAGRGSAGEREDELRQLLRGCALDPQIFRTEGPEHAQELAKELCARGEKVVVAAGGDGTLHEVAQALVGTSTALGILPLGSGNDYARSLGIPADLRGAVETLRRGKQRQVDVGEANGQFYLNSLGMGIDGQIAHDYRTHRFLRGEVGYLLATLFEVLRFRPVEMEVRAEEVWFSGKCLSVAVMNGPWAGGGFCLSPHAKPDDGVLDLAIIGHYPRLIRLAVLPKTRDGSYLSLRRTKLIHVQRATIHAERPLIVHMDGELLAEPASVVEVELYPKALCVVA